MKPLISEILPAIWCRTNPSPDIFLRHLLFRSAPDENYDFPPLSQKEKIIAEAVKAYVQNPGHPDCPLLRALIPGSEYVLRSNDLTLRSSLFLFAATGSRFTPAEADWEITVCGIIARHKDAY